MRSRFAGRMRDLRASDIREILKLTERPSVISFAGGLPAAEMFPVEQMQEVADRVLAGNGGKALQYSTTEGHLPLRRRIAERMNRLLGTAVNPETVLITSGSQQGLDLSGKIFLDEGDVVLCESPTYLGAINALNVFRPRFVEVPTDDAGMVPEALESLLESEERVKVVYVIPDFQNPTGRTWSLERRRRFMEVINRFEVPVIEDHPYGDLRFEGEPLPPLKAMDEKGLVVFLGTFSKILCPGLRIGWLAAERSLFEKYVIVKQGADLHTSTLSQMQIATYMEMFDLEANIERVREVYRARRNTMVAALERELPDDIVFTRPRGGLFVWVQFPEDVNAREVLTECLEHDVAFVPGGAFFPNGGHENTCRLNFSAMPENRIDEGVRRFAAVLRAHLERQVGTDAGEREEILVG